MEIRNLQSFVSERRVKPGRDPDKVACAAVLKKTFAGTYQDDLSPLVAARAAIRGQFTANAVALLAPHSQGKAALVGLAGEQEHGVAMLTSVFGKLMWQASGKAWISSLAKRTGPGRGRDILLAHKDVLYVRSHYNQLTATLHAPLPDEIDVVCAPADRGRCNNRVGGLGAEPIKGAVELG